MLSEGGVRGGGPGTISHKVFPCSLPLSPSAYLSRGGKSRFRFPRLPPYPPDPLCKGGKRTGRSCRRSIARNKNTRLETVPSVRSTPTFHRPSRALPSLGLVDLIGSKHPVGRSSPQLDGHLVERRERAILERVPFGSLRRAAAQEDAQAQLAKLKVVLHQSLEFVDVLEAQLGDHLLRADVLLIKLRHGADRLGEREDRLVLAFLDLEKRTGGLFDGLHELGFVLPQDPVHVFLVVAHDVGRAVVESRAVGLDQQIRLQLVGKAEDDLAAGMFECQPRKWIAREYRAQGELEDVARPFVGPKVVALPVVVGA